MQERPEETEDASRVTSHHLTLPDLGDFSVAGDFFVTFLYASTINLILASDVRQQPITLLSLLMIVFIFSDWLSRVWLPRRLPPPEDIAKGELRFQVPKSVLEVGGLTFLALSFLSVYPPNTSQDGIRDYEGLFALFLFLTFTWNFLMFGIMEGIEWRNLLRASWAGTMLEVPGIRYYGNRFFSYLDEVRAEADRRVESARTARDLRGYGRDPYRPYVLSGWARIVAQLVGVHLAWANLLVGALLLTGAVLGVNSNTALIPWAFPEHIKLWEGFISWLASNEIIIVLVAIITTILLFLTTWERKWFVIIPVMCLVVFSSLWKVDNLASGYAVLVLLLILLVAINFAVAEWRAITEGDYKDGVVSVGTMRAIGAALLSFIVIISYGLLSLDSLIVIIASQQVFTTAFLSFAREREDPTAETPGEHEKGEIAEA